MDTAGRVVHASSFSKTVSPGVRVGYLAGPEDEIKSLAKHANEQYISPNMLAEAIVGEFCRSGAIDRSIATVKRALRERRDAVASVAACGVALGCSVQGFAPSGLPGPKGNLETFVWLAEGSRGGGDWDSSLAEVAV